VASSAAVRGAKAQGSETTPAKLELNPAVGSKRKGSKAMATKKTKKKKMSK
jgi:hypothetical protein